MITRAATVNKLDAATGERFLDGRVALYQGDSREILRAIPSDSIDSVVTDPPYALVSIVKRFGSANAAPASGNDAYKRASAGFMGQSWDTGETAFAASFWAEVLRVLKPGGYVVAASGTRTYHRLAVAIEDAGFEIRDSIMWLYGSGFPKSHSVERVTGDTAHAGLGTALKPACEPWVLARKPIVGTVAANVLKHGTGALNIDGCRVDAEPRVQPSSGSYEGLGGTSGFAISARESRPTDLGRWPANVLHDGSAEVVAAFPETQTHAGKAATQHEAGMWGINTKPGRVLSDGDAGSAARFFYSAKADADDRLGSKHPTVKPVDLMQYLVRLVTPKGGLVLDPFAGTGTTGEAAWREGMCAVLVEREPAYCDDIRRRMTLADSGPDERKRESMKANGKAQSHKDLPLFGGGIS